MKDQKFLTKPRSIRRGSSIWSALDCRSCFRIFPLRSRFRPRVVHLEAAELAPSSTPLPLLRLTSRECLGLLETLAFFPSSRRGRSRQTRKKYLGILDGGKRESSLFLFRRYKATMMGVSKGSHLFLVRPPYSHSDLQNNTIIGNSRRWWVVAAKKGEPGNPIAQIKLWWVILFEHTTFPQ